MLVGVFSYLLWGTCHGTQNPKYYGKVSAVTDWIKKYVPHEQTCQFSHELKNNRKSKHAVVIRNSTFRKHFEIKF